MFIDSRIKKGENRGYEPSVTDCLFIKRGKTRVKENTYHGTGVGIMRD